MSAERAYLVLFAALVATAAVRVREIARTAYGITGGRRSAMGVLDDLTASDRRGQYGDAAVVLRILISCAAVYLLLNAMAWVLGVIMP